MSHIELIHNNFSGLTKEVFGDSPEARYVSVGNNARGAHTVGDDALRALVEHTVQRVLDEEIGSKHTAENSVDWLEEHVLYHLEINERPEKTLEINKRLFACTQGRL